MAGMYEIDESISNGSREDNNVNCGFEAEMLDEIFSERNSCLLDEACGWKMYARSPLDAEESGVSIVVGLYGNICAMPCGASRASMHNVVNRAFIVISLCEPGLRIW